ncbi:MAG TPA: ATP-binding protein [Bacteroidales bacterium]|nr:ATP-binding protein [Bacteroidales bacterium]
MKPGKPKREISLEKKIFQYLLMTTMFSLILLGFFWVKSEITRFKEEVRILKDNFSENRKAEIKTKVLGIKDWISWVRIDPPDSLLRKVPENLANKEIRTQYIEKLIQDYCLDSISKIRYTEDEYVFINTQDGKALISNGILNHPPVDIFSSGDTSWIRIFRVEQSTKSQPGGFYYTYSFKKISSRISSQKTSYFGYIPEWEWIIGTGFYEDDVISIIDSRKKALLLKLKKDLINVIPFLLLSILLNYLIVLIFSKRLSKNFNTFKEFFSKAVHQQSLIDKSKVSYKEFDDLAETANRMIEESKEVESTLQHHREHLEELVIQRTAELEKEKEHALSADQLKSAFLATMSHELRTPLNSIIGFTGILMNEKPGPLNSEQKKQLGMAQNSARHLLSLINDVLDISKIESGQLKVYMHTFSLPDLINKVVETNRPFADKKKLKLSVFIDNDVKDIISDNIRVQQILLNLVNNAIKFTEAGSIYIKCLLSGNYVSIQITDTGIGIESNKIEQLFKPFMQIDTGLTRKHEGTGLGLSICKKLTEMLNGSIEVDSIYGSGSTFTLKLPKT